MYNLDGKRKNTAAQFSERFKKKNLLSRYLGAEKKLSLSLGG